MVNKRNWLGIFVLVLVFAMTLVGCVSTDEETAKQCYIKITNDTTFNITYVEITKDRLSQIVIVSDDNGIASGISKKFYIDEAFFISTTVTVNLGSELVDVETEFVGDVSKDNPLSYSLSGTDKDSLRLNKE